MLVNSSQLAEWARWIAQAAGSEHEPNPSDSGWYENEVGQSLRLRCDRSNPCWKDALH